MFDGFGQKSLLNATFITNNKNIYICYQYRTIFNWLDVKFDNIHVSGDPSSAIDEAQHQLVQQVNLSPNPATNQLIIQTDDLINLSQITVFNTNGKMVMTYEESRISIDVSALPSGVYFIKMDTDQGIVTKKWVKK